MQKKVVISLMFWLNIAIFCIIVCKIAFLYIYYSECVSLNVPLNISGKMYNC